MPVKNEIPIGLDRYPEFRSLVEKLTLETIVKINIKVQDIKSEMRYKAQFVLEELIRELQDRV